MMYARYFAAALIVAAILRAGAETADLANLTGNQPCLQAPACAAEHIVPLWSPEPPELPPAPPLAGSEAPAASPLHIVVSHFGIPIEG